MDIRYLQFTAFPFSNNEYEIFEDFEFSHDRYKQLCGQGIVFTVKIYPDRSIEYKNISMEFMGIKIEQVFNDPSDPISMALKIYIDKIVNALQSKTFSENDYNILYLTKNNIFNKNIILSMYKFDTKYNTKNTTLKGYLVFYNLPPNQKGELTSTWFWASKERVNDDKDNDDWSSVESVTETEWIESNKFKKGSYVHAPFPITNINRS